MIERTTKIAVGIILAEILMAMGVIIGLCVYDAAQPAAQAPAETAPATVLELSPEQIPAVIEGDQGEIIEDGNIPTVEEIDGGGVFMDEETGVSVEDGMYRELGAIESVNTSSVEAFKNSTLGRCIIANNYYGAQCVSLARAFWWDYAGRDVSTCGTGLAKGMMDCWEQNAGGEFRTIWRTEDVQAGTWVVLDGSYTGHICMALGPVVNGYVACLGENQGGANCGANVGGSATNIINLSVKNFLGGYTPLAYIEPEPEPEEELPLPVSNCVLWHVLKGDTMSKIMLECENTVVYGQAMLNYAKTWYSLVYKPGQSVYEGWTSKSGVGLYAGDDIEHRVGGE